MYKANWMVELGTAFPQLVQPHSTQVQPRPRRRSLPPPLCNDITEGKNREERKTQEQLESAPLSGTVDVNKMFTKSFTDHVSIIFHQIRKHELVIYFCWRTSMF